MAFFALFFIRFAHVYVIPFDLKQKSIKSRQYPWMLCHLLFVDVKQVRRSTFTTRSHTYVHQGRKKKKKKRGGEECQKRTNNGLAASRSISLLRSICRPTARILSLSLRLYLFPMSELFRQPRPPLNNCSKWKEKENKKEDDDEEEEAHANALRTSFIHSFILRVCNTKRRAEEEEATAASAAYVT